MTQHRCVIVGVLVASLAGTVAATAAAEQDPASSASPDFLFGRPGVTLTVRGGWVRARAASDLFEFVSRELTLERRDFHAPEFAFEAGWPVGSRVDMLFGFDVSQAGAVSSYRDFVDPDGLEIVQETTLRQVNLSGGVEWALLPRGRAVGRYTWIPARVVPYVGAGIGMVWYRFVQEGEFVDDVTQIIERLRFASSGLTNSTHVTGGAEIAVTRRIAAVIELRYRWASARLSDSFVGFDPIDLTGARITGGVQFAF